ncbi:MAG: hypothetical protein ACT4P8_12030 [Betaproteobacteria bacterium]
MNRTLGKKSPFLAHSFAIILLGFASLNSVPSVSDDEVKTAGGVKDLRTVDFRWVSE